MLLPQFNVLAALPHPQRFDPPSGFVDATNLRSAEYLGLDAQREVGAPNSTSQRAGERFEAKVLEALRRACESTGANFLAGPGFSFQRVGEGIQRKAFPDALITFPEPQSGILIVEVKLTHIASAWWQLRRKYEPILRFIYPKREIRILEIAKLGSAQLALPEAVNVVPQLPEVLPHPGYNLLFLEI